MVHSRVQADAKRLAINFLAFAASIFFFGACTQTRVTFLNNPPVFDTNLMTSSSVVTGPYTVNASFLTAPASLAVGDFNITNGTVNSVTGSGTNYVISVTPSSEGTTTLNLAHSVGMTSNVLSTVADMSPAQANFSVSNQIYTEGNQVANFTVTLTAPKAMDVNFQLNNASPFTTVQNPANTDLALRPMITIPAGATSVTKSFNLFADNILNPSRDIMLSLEAVSSPNVTFGNLDQQRIHIVDGDGGSIGPFQVVAANGNDSYNCGITTGGALSCWGANFQGQLGNGTTIQRNSPTVIDGGTNYQAVTAGTYHACGVTTGGVLKCWGRNDLGQIGDGTTANRVIPTVIDTGVSYLGPTSAGLYHQSLAGGVSHTCGITALGVLKCWGYNFYGQLGDGTSNQQNSPTIIDSGVFYQSVVAGPYHTCGITGGVVKCWGSNAHGQLGDGSTTQRNVPTLIDSGVSYQMLAAGQLHTCGITTAGVLKCWGENSNGQLGDGTINPNNSPSVIDSGVNYQSLVAGDYYTCGVTVGGVLKCWGDNDYGQLGDGTQTSHLLPTVIDGGVSYGQDLSTVPYHQNLAAGAAHACGITMAGVLKCWGSNGYGQLGDGTTNQRNLPTVVDSGVSYYQDLTTALYHQNLAAGSAHACGITTTGVLKCWGYNGSSQLGDGTTTQRNSPTVIDNGVNYQILAAGYSHTCGITTTGVLKCWGFNFRGQLGDGTTTNRLLPTVIDSGVSYQSVAAGKFHTCGVTTAGVLKCWGFNSSGQLGDGTTTQRNSPIVIDSGVNYQIPATGGAYHQNIAAGVSHTCAVTTAGVLKCWGNNGSGQLGDGTTTQQNVPTVIDTGTSYQNLAAGQSYSCGLTTGGVLKCWGDNASGQLGDGTTVQRISPTIINSGVSYKSLAAGKIHTCGITTAGVLNCWGDNGYGQLGDNTTNQQSVPTVIDSGVGYQSLAAGQYETCGVTGDGVLKCWGYNYSGQLGDGKAKFQTPLN